MIAIQIRHKFMPESHGIFGEFPGIRLTGPWHLAGLDFNAEVRHSDYSQTMSSLLRRYRPWEGKENQEAFTTIAEFRGLIPQSKTEEPEQ